MPQPQIEAVRQQARTLLTSAINLVEKFSVYRELEQEEEDVLSSTQNLLHRLNRQCAPEVQRSLSEKIRGLPDTISTVLSLLRELETALAQGASIYAIISVVKESEEHIQQLTEEMQGYINTVNMVIQVLKPEEHELLPPMHAVDDGYADPQGAEMKPVAFHRSGTALPSIPEESELIHTQPPQPRDLTYSLWNDDEDDEDELGPAGDEWDEEEKEDESEARRLATDRLDALACKIDTEIQAWYELQLLQEKGQALLNLTGYAHVLLQIKDSRYYKGFSPRINALIELIESIKNSEEAQDMLVVKDKALEEKPCVRVRDGATLANMGTFAEQAAATADDANEVDSDFYTALSG